MPALLVDLDLTTTGGAALVVAYGRPNDKVVVWRSVSSTDAIALLTQAGCARVWINGSFVTTKEQPEDFGACWDLQDVDLDRLDPVFFELADGRRTQKRRFGGELLPNVVEAATGFSFDQFFQVARDGTRKGIVVLSITEEKP